MAPPSDFHELQTHHLTLSKDDASCLPTRHQPRRSLSDTVVPPEMVLIAKFLPILLHLTASIKESLTHPSRWLLLTNGRYLLGYMSPPLHDVVSSVKLIHLLVSLLIANKANISIMLIVFVGEELCKKILLTPSLYYPLLLLGCHHNTSTNHFIALKLIETCLIKFLLSSTK